MAEMKMGSTEQLAELQKNATNIRNICILAHVDHGKTTLADSLVASNGIISQRMAGKLRYLDSREDEQTRGITMKSSAISLHFQHANDNFLINLIDSPGHIDFSSEVSTAVRLCDGAIVLVDVIEGVCPQTQAVLRQAWLESIKPVLVLNKVDRLITEWKFTPQEAQSHLQQILEQVNAVTAELFTSDVFAKSSMVDADKPVDNNSGEDQVFDWSSGLEETDDSNLYFSPEGGNVVFASAIDGWGFRLDQFADLYARKVGVSARVLGKTLWGDYYLDTKTKTVRKGAQAKSKKTLFVQLVLENIWKIYDVILIRRDKELAEKIVQTLGVTMKIQMKDVKLYLQSLLNQWLPLSNSILAMVCEKLPSPLQMSEERVEKLLCAPSQRFDSLPASTQLLKNDFLACRSADDAPVVVFVSKMFPVETSALPCNRSRPLTVEEIQKRRELLRSRKLKDSENRQDLIVAETVGVDRQEICQTTLNKEFDEATSTGLADKTKQKQDDHVFIAFARVFSGKIRKGQTLYVLGPKHDPTTTLQKIGNVDSDNLAEHVGQFQHMSAFTVNDLYMFMGRELEFLDEIPAGNVLGIGGLEDHILKSATISSTVACPPFTEMYLEATPIVRVAIEPQNMADMKQLVHGLKLLNQSDPCVEILVQETGEHVVTAAGEVHLQKCLDDLRYRFAKIEINVSAPAVPFRETITPRPIVDRVNEIIHDQQTSVSSKNTGKQDLGIVEVSTTNGLATLRVRALPLPQNVTKLLEENVSAIKTLNQYNIGKSEITDVQKISKETIASLEEFKAKLTAVFNEAGDDFPKDVTDSIWSFGPKSNCTNVLVNKVKGYDRPSIFSLLVRKAAKSRFRQYDSSIVSGFQIATQSGPLCEEPMMGICFVVEEWEMNEALVERFSDSSLSKSGGDIDVKDSEDVNIDSVESVNELNECFEETLELNKDKEIVDKQEELSTAGFDLKAAQFRGQLMSCMKECCRRAFQIHPQRLMWAMYSCVIQATADVLGKMYAVLGKRNGRVLYEDMKEGTSIFNIVALIPVAESFGLADEIRKRTSGLASPQLKFSHWEAIDIDPFWVPTTEEEYLHFGEKADTENVAWKHMNAVRRRKGLKVNEKIVEFGEKQRTLKKNK